MDRYRLGHITSLRTTTFKTIETPLPISCVARMPVCGNGPATQAPLLLRRAMLFPHGTGSETRFFWMPVPNEACLLGDPTQAHNWLTRSFISGLPLRRRPCCFQRTRKKSNGLLQLPLAFFIAVHAFEHYRGGGTEAR